MDEVIVFDKSLQERLRDYMEVFANKIVRDLDAIEREWVHHLENTMDPNGWQAIWKVPRLKCQELHLPYPTLALVYVENTFFQALTASIIIISTQDDVDIRKHQVPLLELWPTKEQDHSTVLYIQTTANSLDMYRFFYTYLLLPWDYDEDLTNWFHHNLGNRLRMNYQMKTGVIKAEAAERIQALIAEAKRIESRREMVKKQMIKQNVEDDDIAHELVQKLLSYNIDMLEIKNEMEFLENPCTRDVVMAKMRETQEKLAQKKVQYWIVFEEGTPDDYIQFLKQLNYCGLVANPEQNFIFSEPLQVVLDKMSPRDSLILNKGSHMMRSSSTLENGGIVKGIFYSESTVIQSDNEGVMLDLRGDTVIENVTIDASNSECAILVRSKTTTLKNCKIVGDYKTSTHQGIIVLKDAHVQLQNCEISGFHDALIGNSGSKISLKNCDIFKNQIGARIYDSCVFKADNCQFRDSIKYGICIESHNQDALGDHEVDFSDLSKTLKFEMKNVSGKNNTKGDVLMNPFKIKPKTDLFSDPAFDITKKQSSISLDRLSIEMEIADAEDPEKEKAPSPEGGDVRN